MTKTEPSDEANDIRLLFSGDEALHNLRPTVNLPPPHNSIPPELVHRYDPVYVEYYNKYNVGRLYFDDVPMEEFRRAPGRYVISYGRAAGPDIFRITEQKCPVKGGEVTVRIFEPPPVSTADGKPKKRAAYVNYHGGCWIAGSLASDHEFCKRLVHELDGQLVVFDVDYRLAPEHPYPIPVDDSWAAFQWVIPSPLEHMPSYLMTNCCLRYTPRKPTSSTWTSNASQLGVSQREVTLQRLLHIFAAMPRSR